MQRRGMWDCKLVYVKEREREGKRSRKDLEIGISNFRWSVGNRIRSNEPKYDLRETREKTTFSTERNVGSFLLLSPDFLTSSRYPLICDGTMPLLISPLDVTIESNRQRGWIKETGSLVLRVKSHQNGTTRATPFHLLSLSSYPH